MRIRPLVAALVLGLIVQANGVGQPPAKEMPPGALTTESLKKMLLDLGYEPYASSPTATWFRLTINRENFNSVFSISISGGPGVAVWFESQATINEPEKLPAPALLKLLKLNEEIGPTYFSIDEKRKVILLNRSLPNRDWTNARMRKEIDSFADLVRRTWPSWDPAAIVPIVVTDSEDAKVERQRFQGDWKVVNQENSGRRFTNDEIAKAAVVVRFDGTKVIFKGSSQELRFYFHLNPTKSPRELEFQNERIRQLVIYRFVDDRLTINLCETRRPTEFETAPGDQCTMIVLERVK